MTSYFELLHDVKVMILRPSIFLILFLTTIIVGAQTVTNPIPQSQLPATGTYQGIAGVQGGIDQYSTNYTMFCNVLVSIPGTTNIAYGDGVHDDTAALNIAINNCPNQQYVYIPTGHYLISAPLSRSGINNFSGQIPFSIIIRGDGPTNTIILNNGTGSAICLSAWGGWSTLGNITNSFRGSTNIGLMSGSWFPANHQWILIDRSNWVANVYTPSASDAHPFYYNYGGPTDFQYGGGSAAQLVKIQNVSGNLYTVWPPLNEGYGSGNDTFRASVSVPSHCGIENLCVVQLQEYKQHNIRIISGDECWIRNVESRQAYGYHISLEWCGGCEVRECYVHEPFPNKDGGSAGGGSDYGIVLGFHSSCCLVEDNIALHCRHSFIMETAAGQDNVIAYNYGKDNLNESLFETDWQEDTDYHGGEPRYNLWEGNIVPLIEADGVEGGTKYDTFFRNLVTRDGLPSVTLFMWAMDIDRGNYYDYFLNNVYLPCTANPSTPIYDIGHWQTDFTYNDPNVLATCSWLGNLDLTTTNVDYLKSGVIYWTNDVPVKLANSLLYSSKPSWFGANVWPPFGRDVAGYTNSIPAQTRALAITGFNNVVNDGNTLTLNTATTGTASAAGSLSYFNGAWVSLAASPTAGYAFSGWSGYPVANSNSPNTYLVMPAANVSLAANFISGASYPLTVVNGTGSGSYVPGASVTISANSQVGQQFSYWATSLPSLSNTNNATTTLIMPSNGATVTAMFITNAVVPPTSHVMAPPSNLIVQ